ncbi:MAG TPA: hypothetical protein VGN80_00355 [Devosiaceae bacterium]|jgi:hypothetical protein|nr:hypothetical protein [Devosiaceae bacterium]
MPFDLWRFLHDLWPLIIQYDGFALLVPVVGFVIISVWRPVKDGFDAYVGRKLKRPINVLFKRHFDALVAVVAAVLVIALAPPWLRLWLVPVPVAAGATYLWFHTRQRWAMAWQKQRILNVPIRTKSAAMLALPLLLLVLLLVESSLRPQDMRTVIYLLPPWGEARAGIEDEKKWDTVRASFAELHSGLTSVWEENHFSVKPATTLVSPEQLMKIRPELGKDDVEPLLNELGFHGKASFVALPLVYHAMDREQIEYVSVRPKVYVRDPVTGLFGDGESLPAVRAPPPLRSTAALLAILDFSRHLIERLPLKSQIVPALASAFEERLRKHLDAALTGGELSTQTSGDLLQILQQDDAELCSDLECAHSLAESVRDVLSSSLAQRDQENIQEVETIAFNNCLGASGLLRNTCWGDSE